MGSHHRSVIHQPGSLIDLRVAGAVREEALGFGSFPLGFDKVGLKADAVFCRQLSEPIKQVLAAGRREPGRYDRLSVLISGAVCQKFFCLPHRLHDCLAQVIRRVHVHIHLADEGAESAIFHLPRKVFDRLSVDGAEDGGVHGAICNQIIKERVVDLAGVIHVGKFRFLREGVGVQPVGKEKVHAKPALRVLRRMHVQIRKGRNYDTLPKIRHRQGGEPLGQGVINAIDDSVFHSYVTVWVDGDFIPALRIDYVSAIDFHTIVS